MERPAIRGQQRAPTDASSCGITNLHAVPAHESHSRRGGIRRRKQVIHRPLVLLAGRRVRAATEPAGSGRHRLPLRSSSDFSTDRPTLASHSSERIVREQRRFPPPRASGGWPLPPTAHDNTASRRGISREHSCFLNDKKSCNERIVHFFL